MQVRRDKGGSTKLRLTGKSIKTNSANGISNVVKMERNLVQSMYCKEAPAQNKFKNKLLFQHNKFLSSLLFFIWPREKLSLFFSLSFSQERKSVK